MLEFLQTIIVEGKYDKAKLANIVSSSVVSVNGFDIYKNKSKQEMIKKLAMENGIIVLTDSDSAGNRIRNYIKNFVGEDGKIINAYIPDVLGKEKRKDKAGKEGKLGVEGIDEWILSGILSQIATPRKVEDAGYRVDMYDLYENGIIGGKNSKKKRQQFCIKNGLPRNLSVKQFLEMVNVLGINLK